MTEALVELEKRKLKSTVRASWIVLTIAFFISIIVAGYFGAIESAGFSIPFLLLPFAMVIGASSALGLRKEPERSAQEFLPLSPSRKFLTSYRVQLKYLGLFYFVAFLLTNFRGLSLPLGTLGDSGFWLFAGLLLHLNLFTFFFCYWFSQPVMACGVAFFISSGLFSLVLLARNSAKELMSYSEYFTSGLIGLDVLSLFTAIITFPAAILLLLYSCRIVAQRIEVGQRFRVGKVLGIVATILLPALVPAILLSISMHVENLTSMQFKPLVSQYSDYLHDQEPYAIPGTVLVSATGRITHVDSKGHTSLLYDETRNATVLDLEVDSHGQLWALIQPVSNSNFLELWGGSIHKRLVKEQNVPLMSHESADITILKGEIFLRRPENGFTKSTYMKPSSKEWLALAPDEILNWNASKVLKKTDGDHSWFLKYGNYYLKVDGSGNELNSIVLPGPAVTVPSKDGIYYELERKLYLIDWDFKIHEIRPLRFEE